MRCALALFGMLLAGCDPCASSDAARIELGTGADAFASIADGDVLDVAFGAQGGQHVWGAVHTEGIALGGLEGPRGAPASAPQCTFALGDDDGVLGTWGPAGVAMGGRADAAGITVVLGVNYWQSPWLYPDDYDPDTADDEERQAVEEAVAADVEGRELRFTVSVLDRCDRTADDARTVRLRGVGAGW